LKQAFLDRRGFLAQGTSRLAGAAILAVTSLQAAADRDTVSPPKPKGFIDAHVHLWTRDFLKYPLAPGVNAADMQPPAFLPSDILRHATPSGVTRIVLVQMSYYRTDNSYMLF
jgi:hypothetical protein